MAVKERERVATEVDLEMYLVTEFPFQKPLLFGNILDCLRWFDSQLLTPVYVDKFYARTVAVLRSGRKFTVMFQGESYTIQAVKVHGRKRKSSRYI